MDSPPATLGDHRIHRRSRFFLDAAHSTLAVRTGDRHRLRLVANGALAQKTAGGGRDQSRTRLTTVALTQVTERRHLGTGLLLDAELKVCNSVSNASLQIRRVAQ